MRNAACFMLWNYTSALIALLSYLPQFQIETST